MARMPGPYIAITEQEGKFLIDLLDMWEEGLEPAKQATIEDKSVTKLDDLMQLTNGYDEQKVMIARLKEKIGYAGY